MDHLPDITALVFLSGCCGVAVLLWVLWGQLRSECATPRYTPRHEILSRSISDKAFLKAIPHATPETAFRIRDIISDQLDVPPHCIHPDDRLVEDLRAD